jgi:hypothetical protein
LLAGHSRTGCLSAGRTKLRTTGSEEGGRGKEEGRGEEDEGTEDAPRLWQRASANCLMRRARATTTSSLLVRDWKCSSFFKFTEGVPYSTGTDGTGYRTGTGTKKKYFDKIR